MIWDWTDWSPHVNTLQLCNHEIQPYYNLAIQRVQSTVKVVSIWHDFTVLLYLHVRIGLYYSIVFIVVVWHFLIPIDCSSPWKPVAPHQVHHERIAPVMDLRQDVYGNFLDHVPSDSTDYDASCVCYKFPESDSLPEVDVSSWPMPGRKDASPYGKPVFSGARNGWGSARRRLSLSLKVFWSLRRTNLKPRPTGWKLHCFGATKQGQFSTSGR